MRARNITYSQNCNEKIFFKNKSLFPHSYWFGFGTPGNGAFHFSAKKKNPLEFLYARPLVQNYDFGYMWWMRKDPIL